MSEKRRVQNVSALDIPVTSEDLNVELEGPVSLKIQDGKVSINSKKENVDLDAETLKILEASNSTLKVLAEAFSFNYHDDDCYTKKHTEAVSTLSESILESLLSLELEDQIELNYYEKEFGLDRPGFRHRLLRTATVHDVGKQLVPIKILRKAGPLTSVDEKQFMQGHALGTYYILLGKGNLPQFNRVLAIEKIQQDYFGKVMPNKINYFEDGGRGLLQKFLPNYFEVAEIEYYAIEAAAHHEHFDGNGYPFGLTGSEIPIASRIVAVADAMAAMHFNNHYSPSEPWEYVYFQLAIQSGRQFDPPVVQAAQYAIFHQFVSMKGRHRLSEIKKETSSPFEALHSRSLTECRDEWKAKGELIEGATGISKDLLSLSKIELVIRNQQLEEELRKVHEGQQEVEKALVIEAQARELAEEKALIDPLTQVHNKKYFSDHAFKLVLEASREHTHVALAFFDADSFKKINDNLGHDIGDKVISEMARTIKATVRSTDIVIRYGGEEFLVLMPRTNFEEATRLAGRIHEKIATNRMIEELLGYSQTASFGVADLIPQKRVTPFEAKEALMKIFKEADIALYQAKDALRQQAQSSKIAGSS